MKSNREKLTDGDICVLCNSQRRLFEPTVLYCNGVCGMQKIRRNSYYYTAGSKSNASQWCLNCYSLLKDEETIMLDDGTEVRKKDLHKLKNDSMPEEAWVQCDTCDSWVHQICALFNGRKNKSAASYSCPKCDLAKLSVPGSRIAAKPLKVAADLPHCKMSLAIEKGLENHLEKAYMQRAVDTDVPPENVEKVEGITVRVISNMEKTHVVRDEMFARYSRSGCPSEFPVRSKCIALFQKIHGVDVILFGMYVFEYGHNCPSPNRRRVYISYLDSAQFFEPKCYRTTTYQALIVEYLRYVKQRGFHSAHIWSCPPLPGDDYIFYCHPSKQLIPKDEMLRNWYYQMLEKAKSEGIVLDIKTLHDEYFKNDGTESTLGQASDPTCLPYFEGDYIPGEIEKIIKEISAEDEAKSKNRDDLPSVTTSNKGGSKKGTRSNPGELVNQGQDKVMLRLGLAMTNMKDNFIVVHLRSRAFAAAVERGDDVSCWEEGKDDIVAEKTIKNEETEETPEQLPVPLKQEDSNVDDEDEAEPDAKKIKVEDDDENSLGSIDVSLRSGGDDSGNKDTSSQKDTTSKNSESIPVVAKPEPDALARDTVDKSEDTPIVKLEPDSLAPDNVDKSEDTHMVNPEPDAPAPGNVDKSDYTPLVEKEEVSGDVTLSKREGVDGAKETSENQRIDEVQSVLSQPGGQIVSFGDTVDEDEPQENEMFESRQQFLNYCQTNHFQFDELRRAKHTTMMVLFQLHNPNAPMFIPTCGVCYCEITHGTRYHCNNCSNYDLCEDCYEPVITNKWASRGLKFTHDKDHCFAAIDAEADLDVQKTREERSRRIKAHLELLSHAASCPGPPSCTLNNCARMKELFQHVRCCNVNPKKNCKICSRILTLLTVHARTCKVRNGNCPLPFCDRIREKMRRRRQQQQLMDDRRRQAQNQLYGERLQE